MYIRRGTALLSMIMLLLTMSATPAGAATGDSASDPIPLASSLPQTIWVDTTSATAEPDDPSQLCAGWGPSELRLDATTFYSYTATKNTVLVSDARSPGGTAPHASVYTYDSSGALVQWGCSNGAVDRLVLPAGQTYLIMMGTCCEPQGASGGFAELSLTEQPPPLDIDVRVTGALVEQKTGKVILNGIITCNTVVNSPGIQVSGELRQQMGRTDKLVVARLDVFLQCVPSADTPWSLIITPASGTFSVGKAHLTLAWQGSDHFTTDSGLTDVDLRLAPYRQ
jgi:hypothetical protein